MSKRGSRSAIKIDHAKSMIIGSRRGLSLKKKKNPISVAEPPTVSEILALEEKGVVFLEIDKFESLADLISYQEQKINELVNLSGKKIKPKTNSLVNKNRDQLLHLITITQNKIIEVFRIKNSSTP